MEDALATQGERSVSNIFLGTDDVNFPFDRSLKLCHMRGFKVRIERRLVPPYFDDAHQPGG